MLLRGTYWRVLLSEKALSVTVFFYANKTGS